MELSNYIYNNYNERGMKSFEIKVKKLLKNNGITANTVICHNAFMERANGRGSYYNVCEIEIDNNIFHLKSRTNDSMAWDYFSDDTKSKRNLFLAVLSEKINKLKELIFEENEN